MSRSGYCEDTDNNWELIKYRGMVASSIRGKRGQAFLKDLLKALDEMPVKQLIADELETPDGVCALGALGKKRGMDMAHLDPYDSEMVASKFNIADCLAREVAFENDECYALSLEQRWKSMRDWVVSLIKTVKP